MTDDYKEELLDYITGDLEIEQGINEPILTEDNGIIKTSHSNFERTMITESGYYTGAWGDMSPAIFNKIGRLSFTNTDKTVVYGNMEMSNGTYKAPQGALIIADENNNYIGYVTQFSSGTNFSQFETLNVDETNLIYGVDYVTESTKHRFLLLNDVISSYLTYGEYRCVLRKSYNFPSDYDSSLKSYVTYKKFNSANYLFLCKQQDHSQPSTVPRFHPVVITVDVNVGEQNQWNRYTSNALVDFDRAFDSFCIWQDETLQLKFSSYVPEGPVYYEYLFNGTTITNTLNIGVNYAVSEVQMTSMNDTYIIGTGIESTSTLYFGKVNGNSINIFHTSIFSASNIETQAINGLIFCCVSGRVGAYYLSRIYLIVGTNVYSTDVDNLTSIRDLFVKNQFNLYKIFYEGIDPNAVSFRPIYRTGTCTLDYNPNNYNGESYSNYNSLIAHKGTLYNNGNLIFSRNLYNKTILNNTTTSTLQIPNSMLNDTNIEEENLVSETNLTMVNNQSTITKNIYEMLLINFINTINVIDEDTTTTYPTIANYVNANINTGTQSNYEDTQCTKYRINYTDTTTSINSLVWTSIDKFNKETSISIYVDKAMTSIDLISNDENTVYLTIPLEVTVGQYYTINQKVRTGAKPVPVQLQYNNEDINYNNEPVMVYIKE